MPAFPTNLSDLPDHQLARLYQQGLDAAFTELLQRYRLELFHFLYRMVSQRAVAEDLFQETFLQVHLSIDTYDPSRPFKPWLFTIAANKARDWLRRQNRQGPHLTSLPQESDQPDQSVVDLLASPLPPPEQLAHSRELQHLVRQIVQDLPEHFREILVLAYFHQLSYKDLAQVLGIPLGTVKSRLHAAVACFAQAWKARFGELGREGSS